MEKNLKQSRALIVGIALILLSILARRLYIRNFNMNYLISFIAGFGIILVCFLIFKMILKNRK